MKNVELLIEGIIRREGGYVNHPDDSGGPTNFGITLATLSRYRKRQCTIAELQRLTKAEAFGIYLERYYTGPGFDRIAALSQRIADELTDTGVLMGQQTAAKFLQEALNAFNLRGSRYPDITADGAIGPATMNALQVFLKWRGPEGEETLLKAMNCIQGAALLSLAARRQKDESFVYGWIRERVKL